MKKISHIAIVFFVLTCGITAQFKINSVTPSTYYTRGEYSNENSSDGISAYASILFNDFEYLLLSFDHIKIGNPDWDYTQNSFSIGMIKNLYPFYISGHYAHISGSFDYKPFLFKYSDKTNILNVGIKMNVNLFYFGAGFTYLDLNGYKSLNSKQSSLFVDWLTTPSLFLQAEGLYTTVSDGRNLFSGNFTASYQLTKRLSLEGSIMLGERAYYFNPELITVFNQDETQKMNMSIKLFYSFGMLKLIPGYDLSEFDSYKISYYLLGLKISF